MQPSDQEILERNAEAVAKYRVFGQQVIAEHVPADSLDYLGEKPWEETHFGDLAVGYFIALGCSWADSFDLSRIIRYNMSDMP